jgi:hypothetical protein
MGEMIETKANIFMHSFCCLSCDTFIVTSKASSPLTAIQCFLFQFPATFRFINIVQQLLTSSSSSSSHFHPSTFPSKACFRRQFLSKMWPTQLTFLLFILRQVFLSSSTLCNNSLFFYTIGPTDLLHHCPALHTKMIKVFLIYFPKCPSLSTTQSYASNAARY